MLDCPWHTTTSDGNAHRNDKDAETTYRKEEKRIMAPTTTTTTKMSLALKHRPGRKTDWRTMLRHGTFHRALNETKQKKKTKKHRNERKTNAFWPLLGFSTVVA